METGKWDKEKKVTKTDDNSLIGVPDGNFVVVADVSEALTNAPTQQTDNIQEYTTNKGNMKFINADDHELKIASYRTEVNYRGSIQFGDYFETLDEVQNAFTSVLDDFDLAGFSTVDH